MNTVQRTRGIRKAIQTGLMSRPAQKFVIAGDSACGQMMREARRRQIPGPSDSAILSGPGMTWSVRSWAATGSTVQHNNHAKEVEIP